MRLFPSTALGEEEPVEIPRASAPHELTALEHRLKWQTYQSLQTCLSKEKFARAIALTDGLANRLPNDVEVRQWQGIIYFSWGTLLLRKGKDHQARTYFRKALLADPCNITLRQQVEQAIAKIKIPAV